MLKTITQIVTRMEEQLGEIHAKLESLKEENNKEHEGICRRLDIGNGRLAKGEIRDDEFCRRIEKLEEADKDLIQQIAATNIIPIAKWFILNKGFIKILIGIILSVAALATALDVLITHNILK